MIEWIISAKETNVSGPIL